MITKDLKPIPNYIIDKIKKKVKIHRVQKTDYLTTRLPLLNNFKKQQTLL